MRYRRSVTRLLPDGAVLRVTRDFTVRFADASGGYALHGEQVDVAIDAPEAIAGLMQLEAARDESGLFPIALDRGGRIRSEYRGEVSRERIEQAVERTRAELERQSLAPDDRAALSRFVAAVHAVGGDLIAHLPVDLFAPVEQSRRDEQAVPLPGGGEGSVVSLFTARIDSQTGLMREASRAIVTRVAGDRRETREDWSLHRI